MSLGVGPARWMGIQGHEAKGRQVDKEPEGLSLTCPVVLGDLFPLSKRPFPNVGNRPVKMKQQLKRIHRAGFNTS